MKKIFLIFVLCGFFSLMAHSQSLSNDTLHWAKYRKLTWNDFQEKDSAMLMALTDRNKQYLKETKMGSDVDMVNKWAAIIQTELKELEEYK